MQAFLHRTRYAALLLIGCLTCEFIPWQAALAGDPATVANVRFERASSRITIFYDLAGEEGSTYAVTVTMKRKSHLGVNYTPKSVSGDVGEAVPAGHGKRIVWDFAAEFPKGLAVNDIYFSVDAESAGGGISPLVWIGGGVVVAGAAAILLLKKKGGSTTTTPPVAGFPDEPARPK